MPGLYSLAVKNVSPTLVDNDRYEPEQVLVTEISGAVRGSDLNGLIKPWVLPKRKEGVDQKDDDLSYEWGTADVSETVLKQSQPLPLEPGAHRKRICGACKASSSTRSRASASMCGSPPD